MKIKMNKNSKIYIAGYTGMPARHVLWRACPLLLYCELVPILLGVDSAITRKYQSECHAERSRSIL